MATQARTTEEIRDGWDRIAARFDEVGTPISMPLAEQILAYVHVRPGVRFLDVGAGSGALSIPAARGGAQVVAVDIAPRMIERLLARARLEGLSNIEPHVMDGTALDFGDDLFDVAASLNGVSLFPDVTAGMREMVRVLTPGGRGVVAAFGALEKVEFLSYLLGAIRAVVPDVTAFATDAPPLSFQVAGPDVLRRQLTQAGFGEVKVQGVTWRMPFHSGAHLWEVGTSTAPTVTALTTDLGPDQIADITQVLDGMLRERSGGSPGATLTAEMNVGLGTK